MRRRGRLTIEVRAGWVVIYQPGHVHAIIAPAEAGVSEHGLPMVEQVRARLAQAGMDAKQVCLVVPRLEAMVGLEHLPFPRRKQTMSAATLEATACASMWEEPTLQAVSIRRRNLRPGSKAAASWFAVPESQVEAYHDWLSGCGLKLDQVRVNVFEALRGLNPKDTSLTALEVAVLCYPTGGWDIVWLSGCEQGTNYTLLTNEDAAQDLAQILSIMVMRNLSKHPLDDLVDMTEPIDLVTAQCSLRVHLCGGGDHHAEKVINASVLELQAWLSKTGIAAEISVDSRPGWGGWPQEAVVGAALGSYRKRSLPVLHLNRQPSAIRQRRTDRPYLLPAMVITCTLLVTALLYSYSLTLARRLASVRAQNQEYIRQTPTQTMVPNDDSQLEAELTALRSQMSRQSKTLEYIVLIDQVADSDWQVEQLLIQGDHIRITLSTPSGGELLARLSSSPLFGVVSLVGEISSTADPTGRLDHLTVDISPAR